MPVQIEKESGGFSQCNIVINYELKSVVIANDKLKKDSNAIWYKVETPNGSIGWVYGDFVERNLKGVWIHLTVSALYFILPLLGNTDCGSMSICLSICMWRISAHAPMRGPGFSPAP